MGSFYVPGRYDQDHVGECLQNTLVDIQHHALLAFARAARNKDRLRGIKIQDAAHLCLHQRICLSGEEIVFGVAVDQNLARVCTHGLDALGVFLQNHAQGIHIF